MKDQPSPAAGPNRAARAGAGLAPAGTTRVRWHAPAAAGLCFLVGVAAFWPARHHGFVYDDHRIVESNWIVTHPDVWYRFAITSYWPPDDPGQRRRPASDSLYRPLTIGSLRLDSLIHDGDPAGYHYVNLILHGLVSALVFAAAWYTWRSIAAGLFAGLLFAAHPVHAEAVVPIVGRSELLAALFGLALLVRHVRPASAIGPPRLKRHLVDTGLFAATLLSKEQSVFLWPAVALMDLWHRRRQPAASRPSRRAWLRDQAARCHIGLAYAAAAFLFVRFWMFGMRFRRSPDFIEFWQNPLANAGFVERLLTPFRLLWLTAQLFVDPSALSPLWNPDALVPAHRLAADVVAGLVVAAVLVGALVIAVRRRRPEGPWLGAFGLLMTLPLQLVPVASWFYAERWLYVPSAVLIVAIAGIARRIGPWAAATAGGVAILLLPACWSYAAAWRTDETLNRYVLREHPDNYHAARNLASLLYLEGRYDESLRVAQELVDRFPDDENAGRLLGVISAALDTGNETATTTEPSTTASAPAPTTTKPIPAASSP